MYNPLDIVSQEGVYPYAKGGQQDMYSVGPMCRYAEDMIPMLKVLAGPKVHQLSLDTKVQHFLYEILQIKIPKT